MRAALDDEEMASAWKRWAVLGRLRADRDGKVFAALRQLKVSTRSETKTALAIVMFATVMVEGSPLALKVTKEMAAECRADAAHLEKLAERYNTAPRIPEPFDQDRALALKHAFALIVAELKELAVELDATPGQLRIGHKDNSKIRMLRILRDFIFRDQPPHHEPLRLLVSAALDVEISPATVREALRRPRKRISGHSAINLRPRKPTKKKR